MAAVGLPVTITFSVPHRDIATGETGTEFTVPRGDARMVLVQVAAW